MRLVFLVQRNTCGNKFQNYKVHISSKSKKGITSIYVCFTLACNLFFQLDVNGSNLYRGEAWSDKLFIVASAVLDSKQTVSSTSWRSYLQVGSFQLDQLLKADWNTVVLFWLQIALRAILNQLRLPSVYLVSNEIYALEWVSTLSTEGFLSPLRCFVWRKWEMHQYAQITSWAPTKTKSLKQFIKEYKHDLQTALVQDAISWNFI